MAGRLAGKVVLVTGAGSGIGLATARRLAADGAQVTAGLAAEEERAASAGLDGQILDVRAAADWHRVLGGIVAAKGGLDGLVNSAGVHRLGSAEATTAESWDAVMSVNLWGSFLGCSKAIPLLRARGGGAIVNLASIAGIRGVTGQAAYCASKGGVHAMTMALAADHVRDGIRVNCVCPGATATPMIEQIVAAAPDPARMRAEIAARQPIGRMATAEEVAAVIAFLLGEDAGFVTGIALPVDGGRSGRADFVR
jgi:NAD(P)-dependent dehydrogenase (short-subunit alcohol dehydrogenase family)